MPDCNELDQAAGSRVRIVVAAERCWGKVNTGIQTLTIEEDGASDPPDGGTFTLTFDGEETAAINWNDTAQEVEDALNALSTIGTAGVECTGGPLPGTPIVITFADDFLDPSMIETEDNSLVNGSDPTGEPVITNTPNWRAVRIMPGTSLQRNDAIYRSQEIRSDRMMNQSVLGTQNPEGGLPFELSPKGWTNFIYHLLGTDVTTTPGPVNEVQSLVLTGTPTGGTFKLRYNDQDTDPIDYNASAAAVELAFEALSTVGAGNGTCAGGPLPGTPVTITFTGSLAGSNAELTQVAKNSLTGGTLPQVTVDVTTHGIESGHYRHVLKGSVELPVGMTIEQAHLDLEAEDKPYFAFYGARVDSMQLSANINQIVGGSFGVVIREATSPSETSLVATAPDLDTEDPFTSVQIQLLEGSTLREIATVESCSLGVSNNLDRGCFVLGSNLRAGCKPGTRITGGNLTIKYTDSLLLEKAVNLTSTRLKLLLASGDYSIEFYLPNVRLLPSQGVWPSVADGGAIPINLSFEAARDDTLETDIQVTMVVPEADLAA